MLRGFYDSIDLRATIDDIAHAHFYDLPDLLRPGDLLVANESRVIPARIFARKAGRVVQWRCCCCAASMN